METGDNGYGCRVDDEFDTIASTPAARGAAGKEVLNLFEGFAFGFGDGQQHERNASDADGGKQPKCAGLPECLLLPWFRTTLSVYTIFEIFKRYSYGTKHLWRESPMARNTYGAIHLWRATISV